MATEKFKKRCSFNFTHNKPQNFKATLFSLSLFVPRLLSVLVSTLANAERERERERERDGRDCLPYLPRRPLIKRLGLNFSKCHRLFLRLDTRLGKNSFCKSVKCDEKHLTGGSQFQHPSNDPSQLLMVSVNHPHHRKCIGIHD